MKFSLQNYLLFPCKWYHSLQLCLWESIEYEAISLEIGCASFHIAVLHSLIIPTTDEWLASDDFILCWLAVALLTNANVFSDSVTVTGLGSDRCDKPLKPGTFTLRVWCCYSAASESCSHHFSLSSCWPINNVFFSSITAAWHILQNIHTSNTNLIIWHHYYHQKSPNRNHYSRNSRVKRVNIVILLKSHCN